MMKERLIAKNTLPSKAFIQILQRNQKLYRDKEKLRELSTTKPGLQQMLKELLQMEKTTTRKKKITNEKAHW